MWELSDTQLRGPVATVSLVGCEGGDGQLRRLRTLVGMVCAAVFFSTMYREPRLLCTPRNFALSSKILGKNFFLVLRLPLRHFKHIPKCEGHTSSGIHTNKTSNFLTNF